nr:DUF2269 family protein [Roseospira goensis]
MDYAAWHVVHVVAVVVFLGNVTTAAVWKALADRTRHPPTVAYAQRLVTLTDWLFTGAGGAVVLVSGYAMAWLAGWGDLGPAWLRWSLGLLALSWLVWVAALIPCQIAQARMARGFADGTPIPPRYWRLARIWLWVGTLDLVPLYAAVAVMILKPS